MWRQYEITLAARSRGFHLIHDELVHQLTDLSRVSVGMLNLFIQHTSASLTINENADPTVRDDFESHFNHTVKENQPYYRHTYEGPDDMPAHLKNSLLGCSINIPVTNGALNIGLWQGVYLCEHRNHASSRTIVATLHGEERC